VRIIYTDEAGISNPEPVSVVVALIVNPDVHWFPVMRRLRQIWDQHIPSEYRRGNKHTLHDDFTFHAKEVLDRSKYPKWPEEGRRTLLKSMMAIPSEFEIPVVLSAVKRGAFDWSGWPKEKKHMTPAKSDHMSAFTGCIGEANEFVRAEYPNELALIIADDNGEMREILRAALNSLQGRPLPADIMVPRGEDREPGSKTKVLRADRVIDEVCFLAPRNAPFLQIVDACAFGFRRWLAGQSHGEDYLRAISGGAGAPPFPDDWKMFFSTIDHKRVIATSPPNRVIVI
jgi:hypothetical protein